MSFRVSDHFVIIAVPTSHPRAVESVGVGMKDRFTDSVQEAICERGQLTELA